MKDWAEQNEAKANLMQSQSNAPHSYKDVTFGDADKGVTNYLKTLAIGSAPFIAEQAAFTAGDILTGGALTPVHAVRLGEKIAETGLAAKSIARSVAQGGSEAAAKDAIAQGVARTVVGAGVTYPSSLGQVLQNQHEQTGDYNLPAAAAMAVPYSLLNEVGIEGAVARRGLNVPGIQNRVLRAGTTGVVSGLGETVGETGQAYLENLAKKSVDGAYDLTGEDALNNLKESAVGGFALGKAFGMAGGLVSKAPNSLMGGTSVGGGEQETSGTNDLSTAINNGTQTESADQGAVVAKLHAERIAQEQQVVQQQQAEQNAQIQQVADANLQAAQQQQAELTAKKQEATDAARAVVFDKFGGEPILNAKGVEIGITFLGKNYYKGMEAKLSDAVNKVVQDEASKSELAHHVEYAYLDAFKNNNSDKPSLTPSSLASKAEPFIAGVESVEDVIDRIDAEIKKEEGKKSKASQSIVGFLQNFKDNLLGVENGQQQQTTPRVGTVSEQSQPNADLGLLQSRQLPAVGSGAESSPANNVQDVRAGEVGGGMLPAASNGGNINRNQIQAEQVNGQKTTSNQTNGRGISGDGETRGSSTVASSAQSEEKQVQEATTQQIGEELIELVITRTGRMKAETVASYKRFILSYLEGQRIDSIKDMMEWYGISSDQAKQWNRKAKTFVQDNLGKLQVAAKQIAEKYGLSLEQVKELALANKPEGIDENGVALTEENGTGIAKASTQDDESKFTQAKLSATAAEDTTDSVLDDRDLKDEDSGMSTYQGRKGASLQEQFNATETVQQKYTRIADAQEKALEDGNDDEVARLQTELDALISDAYKLDEKNKRQVRAKTRVKETDSEEAYDGYSTIKEEKQQVKLEETELENKKKYTKRQKEIEAEEKVLHAYFADENVDSENASPLKEGEAGYWQAMLNSQDSAYQMRKEEFEQKLWDEQAKDFDLPSYSQLSAAAKADWMLSVKDGRTSLAAMNKVFEDNQEFFTGGDKTGVTSSTTLNELIANFPAVGRVVEHYKSLGLGKVVTAVDQWKTTNDSASSEGAYILNADGSQAVTYREDILNSRGAAHVVRHEIGHAVDLAARGGVYSSQQRMAVSISNGKVVPVGAVADEMFKLYKSSSVWNEFLAYPFDYKVFSKLKDNPHRVRAELFAQLWSLYTSPALSDVLAKEAPLAYNFMTEVANDIKQEQSLSSKTQEIVGRRALAFSIRNSQGSAQDARGLAQAGRRDTQTYESAKVELDDLLDKAKDQIKELPDTWRAPVRAVHNSLFGSKAIGLGVMITEDIAQLAKKYMKSVTKFVDAQHERNQITTAKEQALTTIKTRFEELDKNTRAAVNKIIAESTRDGKWAFDPQIKNQVADAELSKRFNALSKEAQAVIRSVFDYGRASLADKQQTVKDKIDEAFAEKLSSGNEEEKLEAQKDKDKMTRQFASILNLDNSKPYAPFKRFGSFVVIGKSAAYLEAEQTKDTAWFDKNQSDENHYVVEFAETMGEAKEMYDRLAATKKFEGGMLEKPFKKSEARQALYSGTDLYKGFAKLKRVIANEKGDGLDAGSEMMNKLEAMVNEMYLLSLAESSARKSELQRKTISGYNRDMMRAFFTQGMADAHYISNLKTSDKTLDAMVEMQKEAGTNRAEAYPYLNELMAREAQSLQVREPSMLDAANRMAGHWFLTFSPSFYLQQLTQTYVLSLPWLAGRYNYFKSARALSAAYKEIAPLVKAAGLKEHIDFSKASPDVQEMLKTLIGRGRIDIGIESELGNFRTESDNPVGAVFDKTTDKLRGTINRIEAINRATAAIAAYRLELAKSNGDKAKAIEAADKVVHITHGSYDGFNTPRLFNQNAVTRSVTQFRRFQAIQISMLVRMMHQAVVGGEGTEKQKVLEKAMARKQLAFLITHTLALGGMKGMPFFAVAGVAYSILKTAFGDEDDPEDFEEWLRSHGGLLLARGIPASLGLDVSGKLGMGNVFSILPYTQVDLTSRSGLEKAALGAMGPFVGGLLPKMADGVGFLAAGDYYKGLEQFVPNGISGAMKAVRFATEGVTMRNGDMVVSPEEVGFTDAILQGFGLPTTAVTERQYLQGQAIKYDQYYSDRAKEIKHDYVKAHRENDTEAMAKARDEWNHVQESRSKNGYTRQPLSQLIKAPMQAAKREGMTVAGVQANKANKQFLINQSGN